MPRPRQRHHQQQSHRQLDETAKRRKTTSIWFLLLTGVSVSAAFFVVINSCWLWLISSLFASSSSPGLVLGPPAEFALNKSGVPVWQWEPHLPFADKAASFAHPVVLRNAVSDRWAARRKWTPKYLGSRIGRLSNVYENTNRWFGPYFDNSKPLAPHAKRVNPYRTDLRLKGAELIQHMTMSSPSAGHDKFVYYSGAVEELGPWAVDEILPLDELLKLNPAVSSVNAWLGPPNVFAHCHYDGYHNFYVQLHGRKRFWLAPPSAWPWLQPAPFLHPGHAQCQVNLSDTSSAPSQSSPDGAKAQLLEVELQPGDLLYLPPLWFHHVQSLDARCGTCS